MGVLRCLECHNKIVHSYDHADACPNHPENHDEPNQAPVRGRVV